MHKILLLALLQQTIMCLQCKQSCTSQWLFSQSNENRDLEFLTCLNRYEKISELIKEKSYLEDVKINQSINQEKILLLVNIVDNKIQVLTSDNNN